MMKDFDDLLSDLEELKERSAKLKEFL